MDRVWLYRFNEGDTLGKSRPQDEQFAQRGALIEDLKEVQFDLEKPGKNFKIGKLLSEPLRTDLVEFI